VAELWLEHTVSLEILVISNFHANFFHVKNVPALLGRNDIFSGNISAVLAGAM